MEIFDFGDALDNEIYTCNTSSMTEKDDASQSSFTQGWIIFKSALLFIFKHPDFLVPILTTWLIFAGIILYLRYYWVTPPDALRGLFEIFLFVFIISYSVCLANLSLLEMIKQIEDDKLVSLSSAFWRVFSFDAIKVIPLAIIFAIVWFVILILRALTSRRDKNSKSEASMRDAALTLGGMNENPVSWAGLGLSMLEKLLRMTVFLALPAIVWEGKGSFSALHEAFEIIKKHPVQFLAEYALTGTAGFIMAIPLIPIYLIDKAHIAIPDFVWLLILIYEGLIWTLGVYLEQMTVSLLYLWHLKWKDNGATGDLSTFLKPDLLADFHELKNSSI